MADLHHYPSRHNFTHFAASQLDASSESRSLYNSPIRRGHHHKLYHSPRIDQPDAQIFPDGQMLSDPLDRWRYMSKLAGRHRQPHDSLRVNLGRVCSPTALAAGIPIRIGSHIQTLHLPLCDDASQLPEWLDAISSVFPNLRHLYLVDTAANKPAEMALLEKETTKTLSDETLVRRLYVLYRLPHLKSMDGEPFSEQEQKLSRPRDRQRKFEPVDEPSEQPLPKIANDSCLIDVLSEEEELVTEREVEISLNGKPMSCDPDRWEYASVESSAVACEWGCGSLSLPYFQRDKILQRSRDRITLNATRQTTMQLNQRTFEDSIEIDTAVVSSEVCRISTPLGETVSSTCCHPSQKTNPENVVRAPPSRSSSAPFAVQFRSRGVTERVDKLIGAISEESGLTMETIDSLQTIPLTRVQSSPSNLSTNPLPRRKNRPPLCPGSRTRPQRTKRRSNKWRERLNARSNSIFDDDDDDDSDNSDEVALVLEPEGTLLS